MRFLVDSHIQPLGGSEVNLVIGLEMVSIFDGVKFVDAQGVAVPDYGATVSRVEKVFQNTCDIAGTLFQYCGHTLFAFRSNKSLQVFLQLCFVFTEHVLENNSGQASGSSLFPLWPSSPRIE